MFEENHDKLSQREIERRTAEAILRARKARREAEIRNHRRRVQRRLGCLIFALLVLGFLVFLILFPR